jgi:hypothetical protein
MARDSNDIKIDLVKILDAAPEDQKKAVETDIRGEIYAAQRMKSDYKGTSKDAAAIKTLVQEAVDMRDEGADEAAVDYLQDMFEEDGSGSETGGRRRRASKKAKKSRKSKKTKKTKKSKKASKKTRRR